MGNNPSRSLSDTGANSNNGSDGGEAGVASVAGEDDGAKPPPSRRREHRDKNKPVAIDRHEEKRDSMILEVPNNVAAKIAGRPDKSDYFGAINHKFEDDEEITTVIYEQDSSNDENPSYSGTTDIGSSLGLSDYGSNSSKTSVEGKSPVEEFMKVPVSEAKPKTAKVASATKTLAAITPSISGSSADIQKLYNPKFNKKVINHYEFDIDSIIEKLIEIGISKSYSSQLVISKKEVTHIINKSKEIFLSQPTLLELASPIKVVGDLHGQFNDLLRILKLSGFPPHSNYLFLGDYVDRGKQSLETILLLLCFKIKYPNNFFMLRGNHESGNISKIYGFYDEVKRRLGSVKIWKSFVDVFNVLPIAAIISNKIFCVHGGLSPFLKSMKQINKIKRPTDIPEIGLLSDLLWSDPNAKINDWSPNDRGISFFYSKKNVNDFLAKFKFDLIVRGHMVVEDGYEFFNKKRLVTVFSAPNYCGEFNNWGAVMSIDKQLLCSFELLKPFLKTRPNNTTS